MTKIKNTNGDKTKKLELLQNSKTQIVTKLNNAYCDTGVTVVTVVTVTVVKIGTLVTVVTVSDFLLSFFVTKFQNTNHDKIQELN